MVLIKDDHAATSLMQLSNITNYVADEATDILVPLEKELYCITDYINGINRQKNDASNKDLGKQQYQPTLF